MDDYEPPTCPDCKTVMVDDPAGFRCRGCGHLDRIPHDAHYPQHDGPAFPGF